MSISEKHGETFGREYYQSHCGDLPYLRSTPQWHDFFRPVADAIVLGLAPRKVFDAGCAVGFLVEMLWDRGVETHGRDISQFAISEVRADVRSWCTVGSIAEPIEGEYDLVLCIEVLEHMPEAEALAAIRNITAVAPRILFSSSPTDLEEATHVNVRPTRYWLERFAEVGFAPVPTFDATFLCPHAMLLQRSEQGRDPQSLAAFAEIVRQRVKLAEARQASAKARAALERSQGELREQMATELQKAEAALVSQQREAAATQETMRQNLAAVQAEHRRLIDLRDAELNRSRAELRRLEEAVHGLNQAVATLSQQPRHDVQGSRLSLPSPAAAPMQLTVAPSSRGELWMQSLKQRAKRLPVLRRTAKLLWWTGTMQLPARLKMWRRHARAMAEIRGSGLFDAGYYREHNPDLVMSGMDALAHFTAFGGREGRRPSPGFDSAFYLQQYPDVAASGMNPLLHYIRFGRQEGRVPLLDGQTAAPLRLPAQQELGSPAGYPPTARSMIRQQGLNWSTIPVYEDPNAPPTLTILTDSIAPNSLFGGVGTALVIGALLSKRMQARLRLVTRTAPPDAAALDAVLRAHKIQWDGATDFVQVPVGGTRAIPVGQQDLILTTSWWSTRAMLASVDVRRVVYLLQEDERMFYPFGDERLLCGETLAEPRLRTLVNTSLLFDHLTQGPDAVPGLAERGRSFEPAFPAIPRGVRSPGPNEKRNFFFYARPNNHRNLFWRGLEVIDSAIRQGILDADRWNIHFVGRDLPPLQLSGGVRPIVAASMPWTNYAALVAEMDLGLCLMDTPHPSYPPLDLAAAGAVVVTNQHGLKTSLESWSPNILTAPPDVASLCRALRDGAALAQDHERRTSNHAASRIPSEWEPQLRDVLDWMMEGRA
ncbi:methyltransferase domain-containing protein [Pseudoroseomonas globiformis]|uniref:Methyltransferase domain-containing protein n=1 Tax=Teichococcus globiformis TaxID=2307229 RepID=A0ABV7G4T7_9PROT